MQSQSRDESVVAALLKGAAAGAVGTWVMGRVTTWLYDQEGEQIRERENQARGGKSAYQAAAETLARASHVHLGDRQRRQLGTAIHWALGIGAGAGYALFRKRWPSAASLKGLPFGAGFFLVMDEIMNPVLGFTPGPRAFPWQAHARGLAGHLAFGGTSEIVLEGLDRVA